MSKTNIVVKRYVETEPPAAGWDPENPFPWEASVEPEKGDWVLFVPKANSKHRPELWVKVGEIDLGDGAGEAVYLDAREAAQLDADGIELAIAGRMKDRQAEKAALGR